MLLISFQVFAQPVYKPSIDRESKFKFNKDLDQDGLRGPAQENQVDTIPEDEDEYSDSDVDGRDIASDQFEARELPYWQFD